MKQTGLQTYISEYEKLRKQNKKIIKKRKAQYLSDKLFVPLQEGETKPFFRYLRDSRSNDGGIIPELRGGDMVAKTPIEKANALNQQFQSVFTLDKNDYLPATASPRFKATNPIEITEIGVLKLLNGVKVGKAGGLDNIKGITLKTFSHFLARPLTNIFQYSINTAKLPSVWKHAKVVPIYKKGSRHDPANYRPVSLTSVCCKLLEHIIHSHISAHLDKYDILTDVQHGFRAKRSCETQLICTIDDLAKNFDRNLITDIIILDFSKAFDCVNHRKLVYKIRNYGIHDQVLNWITSFLENRTQVVEVENELSNIVSVTSGVPQGSVLGPLLFLLFINDLPDKVNSQCRLFADDALVYATRDQANTLQQDMHSLEAWANLWQMSFNPKKCYHLSVGKSHLMSNKETSFFLCAQKLESVLSNPYLGVELQSDLKWNKHICKIESKGKRLIGMLRRVLRDADARTRKAAYTSLVRPGLEYGCVVWDPHLKKDILSLEQTQNLALRFIFKKKGITSFTNLRENTSFESLEERRSRLRKIFLVESSEAILI